LVLACWHAFKGRWIGWVGDFRAANTLSQHYRSRRRDLGTCRLARIFIRAQVEEVEVEVLAEVGKGWPLNIVRGVVTAQCA
jgi:hypothetical protein